MLVGYFRAPGVGCICSQSLSSITYMAGSRCGDLGRIRGAKGLPVGGSLSELVGGKFLGRAIVRRVRRPRARGVGALSRRCLGRLILRIAGRYGLEYGCYTCSKGCCGQRRSSSQVQFRATEGTVSFCLGESSGFSGLDITFCKKRPLLRFRLVGGYIGCVLRGGKSGGMAFPVAAGKALLARRMVRFLIGCSFRLVVDLSKGGCDRSTGERFEGKVKDFSMVLSGLRGLEGCSRGCCCRGMVFGYMVDSAASLRSACEFCSGGILFGPRVIRFGCIGVVSVGSSGVTGLAVRGVQMSHLTCLGVLLTILGGDTFSTRDLVVEREVSSMRLLCRRLRGRSIRKRGTRRNKPYVPNVEGLFMSASKGFCPYREISRRSPRVGVNDVRSKFSLGTVSFVVGRKGVVSSRYLGY